MTTHAKGVPMISVIILDNLSEANFTFSQQERQTRFETKKKCAQKCAYDIRVLNNPSNSPPWTRKESHESSLHQLMDTTHNLNTKVEAQRDPHSDQRNRHRRRREAFSVGLMDRWNSIWNPVEARQKRTFELVRPHIAYQEYAFTCGGEAHDIVVGSVVRTSKIVATVVFAAGNASVTASS